MQAALDVFAVEPPPADHPLVGREDVICTPHLGASTAEAQEDVSVEVSEVVVAALKVSPPPPILLRHQSPRKVGQLPFAQSVPPYTERRGNVLALSIRRFF